MDSRMNKYHDNNSSMSRVSRNEDLYKGINNTELDNFTVKSNATVLGTQEQDIDIEKLKKILDNKYKDTTKRKSIRIEPTVEEKPSMVPESTTKEYDINSFIAKAHDDKEETYEEARAKKLRDTQYDILHNLHVADEEESSDDAQPIELSAVQKEIEKEDEDLMNLINTITINEVKTEKTEEKPIEPLDLFEDLKGDENTEVFEGIKEEIKKIEQTSVVLERQEEKEITEKKEEKVEEEVEKKQPNLDQTFYTTQNIFNKKDFKENDFEEEKMSIWVKILIILLIIGFLAGLFLFLKSFLNF
mgnify:CR=1 FL=1